MWHVNLSDAKINRLLIGATQPRSRSQVCHQSVNSSITLIQDTKSCLDMPVAANVFIFDLSVVYALNIRRSAGAFTLKDVEMCFIFSGAIDPCCCQRFGVRVNVFGLVSQG